MFGRRRCARRIGLLVRWSVERCCGGGVIVRLFELGGFDRKRSKRKYGGQSFMGL